MKSEEESDFLKDSFMKFTLMIWILFPSLCFLYSFDATWWFKMVVSIVVIAFLMSFMDETEESDL